MKEKNKFWKNPPTKVTVIDKLFALTILRFFPEKVTPNQITIFRFLSVPFVAALFLNDNYSWGTILFTISALSDALDGALARTRDQISEWGKMYDPLADKLLIGTAALLLIPKYLNLWIAVVILFIEMILIGAAYYLKNKGKIGTGANFWGKSKMFCESFGVGFILLFALTGIPSVLIISQLLLYAAIIFAIVSLITYSI
ncbi:MAG: CDP-alcohol phosphatidyltransferase family protein [Patescibacteria group bacterium]